MPIITLLFTFLSIGKSIYYFKAINTTITTETIKPIFKEIITQIKQQKRIQFQGITCLDFIQFTEIIISITLFLMIISKTPNILRKLFSVLILIEISFTFYWYKVSSFFLLISYTINCGHFIFQLLYSSNAIETNAFTNPNNKKGNKLPQKRFKNVNYGGQKRIVNQPIVQNDGNDQKENENTVSQSTKGIKLKTNVSESLLQRKLEIENQFKLIQEKQEQMNRENNNLNDQNNQKNNQNEQKPIVIKEQKEAIKDLLEEEQQLIKVQRRKVQTKRTTKATKVKGNAETIEIREEKKDDQVQKPNILASDLLNQKSLLKKHVKK